MALLKGSCSFENLELNVKVIKQEFKLPFDVICGHVNNLNIEIPWYKLLSNVVIVAETIGNIEYNEQYLVHFYKAIKKKFLI